jgi:hypothetical protein
MVVTIDEPEDDLWKVISSDVGLEYGIAYVDSGIF